MLPENVKKNSFSFPKKERICSHNVIQEIFAKGQVIFCYPFKCYYICTAVSDEIPCNRVAILVPKKRIRKAVDRNYVKRIIRESYRLNAKQILTGNTIKRMVRVDMLFLFVGNEIPRFNFVSDKIITILNRLSKELLSYNENTE